jgi:GT2 family glycosyltransferase
MLNNSVSVIVVFKKQGYIGSCLDSLQSQTYRDLEIIAIDNSLDDNFSRSIRERYSEVKFYCQDNDISYCQALNLGISQSKGDFLLCLNDDITLDREFIKEAMGAFFLSQQIGGVSGKILRKDGKTIDSTGLFLSLWRSAKERGYGSPDTGQFEERGYIFGVNGAAALYRREMLEAIKVDSDYFDADYHFFYEDLDIAWRAKRLGWRCYYIPEAVAYHIRGASARAPEGIDKPYARRYLNTDLEFDLLKNRYLTLIKNESSVSFLLHLPFTLFYDLAAWIHILIFRPALAIKFFSRTEYLLRAFHKRKIIKMTQTGCVKY